MADLCKPDSLHWVDGTKHEYDALCRKMVASGTFIKLNEKLWPGCHYARSDPTDVARVEDAASPPTQTVTIEGKDAVYLNVLRVPGGNTLEIVDEVIAKVAHLENLPPGVHVEPIFDQSSFVRSTYHGLKKEVVQALVLVALVILLFLQSFRGTLVVSLAIPLSFAITLLVLYAKGETLNAFTLGGLTLAMGRLVDDAVVVLESIHRHLRKGLSSYEAALQGTNAVALPVLASTLSTIAVLLPVLLLVGLARKLFSPLALTVAVAMMASYLVSMFVTPVVCRYFFKGGEHRAGSIGQRVEHFEARRMSADHQRRRQAGRRQHLVVGDIVPEIAEVVGRERCAVRPAMAGPQVDGEDPVVLDVDRFGDVGLQGQIALITD